MVDRKRALKPARIQELLARNIKEARGRLKLTQEALAERCDLTTSFIGEVEICPEVPPPPDASEDRRRSGAQAVPAIRRRGIQAT